MVAVAMLHKPKKEIGLKLALVFEDGYQNWGWWCPSRTCSPNTDELTTKDGFKTRDGAVKSAHRHEKEAGH